MKNKKSNKKNKYILLIFLIVLFTAYFFTYNFLKEKTSKLLYYVYFPVLFVEDKISDLKNMNRLSNENDVLLKENIKLKVLNNKNIVLEEEISMLKQTLDLKNIYTNYEIINATIIERNKTYWLNTFTIDKGKDDFIAPDMAVVTNKGLVGKVITVYNNTSIVKMITNNDKDNKISIKVKGKDGYLHGIVSGYDINNNLIIATGITNYEGVVINEKVLTSGFSIFPDGIEIGKIVKIENDNLNISKILYISPNQDMNNIKYISVLGNKLND